MDVIQVPDFGTSRCPVCGRRKPEPAVLVPLSWTVQDNGTAEAALVHVGCLDLVMFRDPAGGEKGVFLAQSFQVEEGA